MIKIQIGSIEKSSSELSEGWLTQQIMEHRKHGREVCIRVSVDEGGIDMLLSTCGCQRNSSSENSRPPNPREEEIFEIWRKRGLNEKNYPAGQLIAFLKEISR